MAKQHGIAGEWARVRGTVLSLWPLFLSFVLLGAFLSALILGAAVMVFGSLFVASDIPCETFVQSSNVRARA